ncbi:MAG: hypothetical protein PW843_11410 [Azospirillaceae bacterium]|nr:hypothetical protein [Azospirillaceae bacterium]
MTTGTPAAWAAAMVFACGTAEKMMIPAASRASASVTSPSMRPRSEEMRNRAR